MTQRSLKTIFFFFEDKHLNRKGFNLGDLDLQYRTPEMGLPNSEIEKNNFRDSQEK